jgi:hypothetical protein
VVAIGLPAVFRASGFAVCLPVNWQHLWRTPCVRLTHFGAGLSECVVYDAWAPATFTQRQMGVGSSGVRRNAQVPRDLSAMSGVKMRYYFHVISVKRAWRDYEGLSCSNADDAKIHAGLMASELFRLLGDEFVRDERLRAISLLVIDERGKEITRMPLEFARSWRRGLH